MRSLTFVCSGRIWYLTQASVMVFAIAVGCAVPATVLAQQASAPAAAGTAEPLDFHASEFEELLDSAVRRSAVRISPLSRGKKEAGLTPAEIASIADNCVWGMPKVMPGAGLGRITVVARDGYVAGHSNDSKIPYWVCEHSVPGELVGPGNRDNSKFLPDPKLPVGSRAELSDYKGSGFDRGHMHPAANAKKSQVMMDETHFLSNMLPQFGPTFNRGIWAELESAARDWTRKRGETWIISGPMFYDPLEETEETADGVIDYMTIGENDVAVPTHCYKIIVSKNAQGEHESIAFFFENRRYGQPFRLNLHITTIDWIEERTGLNFFPDLGTTPATLQLEAALESKKSAMWERN